MTRFTLKLALAAAPLIFILPGILQAFDYEKQASDKFIPQPVGWVAFTARVTRVHPETGAIYTGKIYRRNDGSTRTEIGYINKEITTISIQNVTTRTFYLWSKQIGVWASHPMRLPDGDWKPFPKRYTPEISEVAEPFAGLHVVRAGGRRAQLLLAPALNFFPMLMTQPCVNSVAEWCGVAHSDVRLGEPPSELFEPPVGAEVVVKAEPAGIVYTAK